MRDGREPECEGWTKSPHNRKPIRSLFVSKKRIQFILIPGLGTPVYAEHLPPSRVKELCKAPTEGRGNFGKARHQSCAGTRPLAINHMRAISGPMNLKVFRSAFWRSARSSLSSTL